MSVGDAEDEAMAIVHSLRALTVDLNVAVSGFANKYKMHSTDVRALICLLDAERSNTSATPGWLGSQLGINSASVTALVDRMVKAGHVARERDSADRRRVLLQVTPSAVTLGESFFGPSFHALRAPSGITPPQSEPPSRVSSPRCERTWSGLESIGSPPGDSHTSRGRTRIARGLRFRSWRSRVHRSTDA